LQDELIKKQSIWLENFLLVNPFFLLLCPLLLLSLFQQSLIPSTSLIPLSDTKTRKSNPSGNIPRKTPKTP
jgi:hypothetical protein